MPFTYDPTTDRGRVRLLSTDVDSTDPCFTDEEVDAFLTLASSSVLLAAAMAIESIARSEVLVQKVIKLLDLQTDGASVARELRMSAGVLRKQAEAADETFDWAEMVQDQFTYRNKLIKESLRGG